MGFRTMSDESRERVINYILKAAANCEGIHGLHSGMAEYVIDKYNIELKEGSAVFQHNGNDLIIYIANGRYHVNKGTVKKMLW